MAYFKRAEFWHRTEWRRGRDSKLTEQRPELRFVLGVDMAHMGIRYGHERPVRADEGDMLEVRARDEARIARICDFDARGFFELVLFFYIESRRFLIRDSPRPATTYEQKTGGADGVKGA